MGYDSRKLVVTARVSRHNDERDERDDGLWDEFCSRVSDVASEPEFKPITVMTHG